MSHQDLLGKCHAACLQRALQWLFAGVSWSPLKFRDDCTWTPRSLAGAALLWAWSDEQTLGERFRAVRKIIKFLQPEQVKFATSYQAFIKLLERWTPLPSAITAAKVRRNPSSRRNTPLTYDP